jgi:CheY-like chemotaxis protein
MSDGKKVFLIVEDSEHDILAFRRAWKDNAIADELRVVRNGRECLDYLQRRGNYDGGEAAPRPDVIILNNRLPAVEGLTVLKAIRQIAEVAYVPVIIFTAAESNMKEERSYDLGANAYVVKPMKYSGLLEVVRRIHDFWKLVKVPEDLHESEQGVRGIAPPAGGGQRA